MSTQYITVGDISKGLTTDRLPFNIDNDAFPVLINAYQWRGRIKRKRGTALLNRIKRFFNSASTAYSSTATLTLSGGGIGAGNILSGFSTSSVTTLAPNASIIPGSVTITAPGPTLYTDPSMDGTLSPSGTINYATGAIVIAAQAGNAVSAQFNYYPTLPVLGLEDFVMASSAFPGTIAFDDSYSYQVNTAYPYSSFDVSFYKNPASSGSLPSYTPKTTWTPTTWNGQDYQQFWTTNYQGALWATNGINVPFSGTNIGMQFNLVTEVTMIVPGPPATARLTIAAHGLVVGDFLFLNEFPTATVTGINFQTCYVTNVPDVTHVDVEFPNATLGGAGGAVATGIAQYLTNRSDTTKDCLRWYDGAPVNGTLPPVFSQGMGWVNFAPPLLSQATNTFIISDLPVGQYYLVGARIIVPFKDRLLFFGPVVQTSSGTPKYLQDTVIYSQNGTPYYTCSFTGDAGLATTVFNPILLPTNQTSSANAFWEDQVGFGGFIQLGVDQPINTVSANEDVLILGLNTAQVRMVYTGNDAVPFNFFITNSELGSTSTFSAINMDKGVITKGSRGFVISGQTEAARIDLSIPDQVFQVALTNNGTERVTAQRDFINEWIYFTYLSNQSNSGIYTFPTQTLLYNYRDQSWAIFDECYTTYGTFRKQSGFTWGTVGETFPTWGSWNQPWNAGDSTLFQPAVIAGNQQGFVVVRDTGTNESNSLSIKNVSGVTITCPNHCLNTGDYIIISGCLGVSNINGNIYSVTVVDIDTFTILGGPNSIVPSGTYLGGGLIKRMYIPLIQTKQFPLAWGMGRKTRIGVQQYLLSKTANGQITLQIYLSQNAYAPYNNGPLIPNVNTLNDGLIYSSILYTCPESINLGLTPANINLQTPTASQQSQIWHRQNTSLIGDTVQLGFTLSDAQMRDTNFNNQFAEIELHGMIIAVTPSQLLV
ncbi:MAG: hypothetical protein KGZ39_00305 [Simkania sp.]|nr:hypothetical protein [Simkania sp.]